jgi:hypothetical protein
MTDTIAHQNQQPHPSLEQTKDFISVKGQHTDIPLENHQIHHFQKLFQQAYYKLSTIPECAQYVHGNPYSEPARNMLHIIDHYQSPFQTTETMNVSASQQLAWDFCANFQTDHLFNRCFLLGTPSQKQS